MKYLNRSSLVILLVILFTFQSVAQKQVLNNHFDVVEKLSAIKSKTKQVVIMMKKKFAAGTDLDSTRLLYIDLKASSDGVISRYKAVIDNPKLAKKEGENISAKLDEVEKNLNLLRKYNIDHGNNSMGLAGVVLVATVTEIGKGLYTEIKSLQKEKRDAIKLELDQYILPEFDEIE
ncbi:MAG: hypothetical protein V4717_16010 [Bacteroidota bacterium]